MSIRMEMSLNLSNLTDAAQKNLSNISRKISIQKGIIDKERAVFNSKKSETYRSIRAKTSLETFTTRYLKTAHLLDSYDDRFEEADRKLEESFKVKQEELDELFKKKQKELEDTFEKQRTLVTESFKVERIDLEDKVKQLEKNIKIQEDIIHDETTKESDTIVRANAEIDILTKERNKILKATGVFETPVEPTPARQAPVPPPQEILEPQEITNESLDFAIFMRDGRQDGQPIDPNPSYLNSVALGACMTSKEKKKKGVKMP